MFQKKVQIDSRSLIISDLLVILTNTFNFYKSGLHYQLDNEIKPKPCSFNWELLVILIKFDPCFVIGKIKQFYYVT